VRKFEGKLGENLRANWEEIMVENEELFKIGRKI
jgi:hypothetical protein